MPRAVNVLVLACCCSAFVTPGRAEEFYWEISGAAHRSELDPVFDIDRSTVSAAYFFGGVDDAKGPLALASLLDPTTRVSASISREEMASHVIGPGALTFPDFITETEAYAIGGRYVLPRAKWYVGGNYVDGDVDPAPGSLTTGGYAKESDIFAGRYLGSATTIELELNRAEKGNDGMGIVCISTMGNIQGCAAIVPQTTRATTDNAALGLLHVRKFRALTYSLSARVAQTSGQVVVHSGEFQLPSLIPSFPGFPAPRVTVPARDTTIDLDRFLVYSLGGELFATSKLGVRVGYSRWDGAPSTDDAYDVATTWFVTRNVGLRFVVARQRADDAADFRYTDSASVQAIGRF